NYRPFIREDPRLFGSHNDHRFNGNHHPRFQDWILLSLLDIVEHLRVFVHATPKAVAAILAHDGEARLLDMLLYRPADVLQAVAGASGCDATVESILCYFQEAPDSR